MPGFPDRIAIEAHQIAKLRALLAVLEPDNPFYSRKFRAAGVPPNLANLEEFSERVPFTLKHELVQDQRDHPPYGSNLTFPLECYTRFNQTSGTAGQPMRWLDVPESWEWMLDNWARVYRAADVTAIDAI